jgi:hypothetical protein
MKTNNAVFAAMLAAIFFIANSANAVLIYDLRAESAVGISASMSSDGKSVLLPAGFSGAGTINLQLWGVIDDVGANGFQDDILITGNLNIYAKNKTGNGAISATSGVTAAAFPTTSAGNFFNGGSNLGLGGANVRNRTTANPGVIADVPTLVASADGLDWGSDEDYIQLPPPQGLFTVITGYLKDGSGTTPSRLYSWAMASSGFAAGQTIAGFSQAGTGINAGKWEVLLGTFTVSIDGTKSTPGQTIISPFTYQRLRPISNSASIPGMNYKHGAVVFAGSNAINEATQLSGVILAIVPEPTTVFMMLAGIVGLAFMRKRKSLQNV